MVLHHDYAPIEWLIHDEPLVKLRDELNNISFEPKRENIFRAYQMPLKDIKVVILGMDPYPTKNLATGLAFEVPETANIPFSLKVIAKELENEGLVPNIKLYEWFKNGVMLLNTALTVATGQPGSHILYWKRFTEEAIKYISGNVSAVWLLWGNHAKWYIPKIANHIICDNYTLEQLSEVPVEKNYIFTSVHPAAEAYGKGKFIGNEHFKKANRVLITNYKKPIFL